MEKKDHAAFMKVLQLKNSQNENILHCMIQQNWIDLAENLINKIQKHDASICNTLMVSRNLADNSTFMLILRKMAIENNDWSNEFKENILSIWKTCVENNIFTSNDIFSPNNQNQTIIHLCIQG